MSSYKLIYFNGTGRAELVRWIFAYGNIKYTDQRFELSEWRTQQSQIYGGRVPLLMVNEKPLPQSLAQARYVAKEADLIPKDNLQAAYCDALAHTIEEIFCQYFPILMREGTPEELKEHFKKLHTENITPFLSRLNDNLSGKTWFAGDQVSWGDLAIANAADQMQRKMPYLLDSFPDVDANVKKTVVLPRIKEWLENRPKTFF